MSYVTYAAAAIGIINGLQQMGNNPGQSGQQAQQMVDPFAQYRNSYAALLNQFMGLGVGGSAGGTPAASPLVTATPTATGLTPTQAYVQQHIHSNPLSALIHPSFPGASSISVNAPPSASTAPPIGANFGVDNPLYQAALGAGLQAVERRNPGMSGNRLIGLQDYSMRYGMDFNNMLFNRLAQLSGAIASPAAGGLAGISAANAASANQSQGLGMVLGGLQQFGQNLGNNPDTTNLATDFGTGLIGGATPTQ